MQKKPKRKNSIYRLLKGIAKGIYYVLSKIYFVIDKIIVTPVAKLMLLVQKPFKGSSKRLDRLLNNKIVI